jgi:magnesium chelatase subunit D
LSDLPEAAPSPWPDALLSAALFAIDPAGTGGVSLRAHAGPVRDAWMATLRSLLPEGGAYRRMPSGIADGALLGGLDLAATLQAGRPVSQRGLLAEADGGIIVVAMAERVPAGTAARLTGAMDTGMVVTARDGIATQSNARFGVVALDESDAEDEAPPPALLDRLAFLADLRTIGMRETAPGPWDRHSIASARERLADVDIGDDAVEALCKTALSLGIAPLRPCLLAASVARAHAALAGRPAATLEDAAVAARLVLAPRATMIPQTAEQDAPPEQTEPEQSNDQQQSKPNDPSTSDDQEPNTQGAPPEDMVLEAAKAAIPANLLAKLGNTEQRAARARNINKMGAGKVGTATKGLRGRPKGVREAAPRDGERLNLVETLRAAAPWQPLRRREAAAGPDRIIHVRSQDFRVTTLEQKARTTTIFVVDASGSSAFNRLAEAKGAVELLLADCYRRRDEVAVLAFRGKAATLLLPPTRSLVRAKRSLAGLPGGGGTPLAAGLLAGAALAESVRRGGFTPTLVVLTDGRGNIALDGTAARSRAAEDTEHAAKRLRAAGLRAVLVDTSPRPQPAARTLAQHMGGLYLPLPYADSAKLSRTVKAAVSAAP